MVFEESWHTAVQLVPFQLFTLILSPQMTKIELWNCGFGQVFDRLLQPIHVTL